MTGKDLVKVNDLPPEVQGQLTEAALAEYRNLGGEDLVGCDMVGGLPIIKISHQSAVFDFEGQDTAPKKFQGVVVYNRPTNVFWLPKGHPDYDETNSLPHCSSADAIIGSQKRIHISEDPLYLQMEKESYLYGKCAECYLGQFGSAVNDNNEPTAGKACRWQRRLFVLCNGSMIPWVLFVPPTSTKQWRNYAVRVAQATKDQGSVATVVTEFSLRKVEKGAQVYSVLEFLMTSNLIDDDPVRLAEILNWRAAHRSELEGRAVEVDIKDDNTDFSYGANK